MTPLAFRKKVLDFYRVNARSFPWRPPSLKLRMGGADPYKILVSEIMLQQTQTHRVIAKYKEFIAKFPTIERLAAAPFPVVLKTWQGLGYNRRAQYLHRVAKEVVARYGGELPRRYEELRRLPGVGPYTAAAVVNFAHNEPCLMIETNIRAALIHEFFPKKKKVADAELLPLLERAMPRKNPRIFYQALMDYGAFLKQKHLNPSRRSAHHARQSPFKGSDRQIRGEVLRLLLQAPESQAELLKKLRVAPARAKRILAKFRREGLIQKSKNKYIIKI